MSILVSVYCLTYNHEKYIRSALEGFVNQKTNFDYEVFVHDDASTDMTASIVLEFAEKYPHIIKPIIQKENQYSKGVIIADKYILPLMSGKYVAICEGDDYWCDERKLQRQVDFLENHPNYVACTHNSFIHDQISGKKSLFLNIFFNCSMSMKRMINWKKVFHISSVMYRRNIKGGTPVYMREINCIGDFNLALWLRLNGKIHYMAVPMSVIRRNVEGSWTMRNQNQNKSALAQIEMLKLFDKESKGKYRCIVTKQINKLNIEALYRSNDIDKLHDMGYVNIISAGYIGVALAVFLQLHNYKLYQMISEFLYGKKKDK